MPVAQDAPVAAGAFGVIVVSHGAGGMALLHRDLGVALASHAYVVAAPTHPRGKGNDVSGVGVWVGRPKQVSRVIDAVLEDGTLGSHIDRGRIGVGGHSSGSYTALAVAGAQPSPGAEGARDPDGFDRDAFHEVMNREIVEFFNRTIRPAGNTHHGPSAGVMAIA